MASTTSTPLSISSSSTLIDTKAATRQSAANSSQMVALPTLPPLSIQSQSRAAKTTAYCRKIARNVMAMATGEAPAEVVATTELPDIVKTIQESWDKVEDKYAVTSLAVAGGIAVLATSGMISAIDRLPLVPGVLELVGIGYTGWFAYKNLVSKTEREILIQKIKDTYKEIIGTS
ncbi:CURVATURE THYLAKOID 1B, chloroplastic-like [Olea europaea subsp. europaea]|uniref:CURVATURE THYLAKOID 1B, chloroplastic-like n=1 Tax=Olea europaea subsp. europaea TaxID=158383 RepID=A0A8S0QSN9_OLEEU|nr:CURVATURE THYLAKOID 1B, chloroplastic-like [Olea europaea subsp. europaea]